MEVLGRQCGRKSRTPCICKRSLICPPLPVIFPILSPSRPSREIRSSRCWKACVHKYTTNAHKYTTNTEIDRFGFCKISPSRLISDRLLLLGAPLCWTGGGDPIPILGCRGLIAPIAGKGTLFWLTLSRLLPPSSCCLMHDCCYENLTDCHTKTDPYQYSRKNGVILCGEQAALGFKCFPSQNQAGCKTQAVH